MRFRTDSPRIQKREQLSLRRYKPTLMLDKEIQIDAEPITWLNNAYQLAG